MEPLPIDPVFWSTSCLVRYGDEVVHGLATTAIGTVTSCQYFVGRCLLAMKQERWYENYACSSIFHYAAQELGVPWKEARRYYRVALDLTYLPKLSRAAAHGQIPWGKLREISRKASPETEQFWIELAKKLNYAEIQRLVARTEKYDWPKIEDEEEPELQLTELRCRFQPEMMEMLEHVRRKLSEEAGRPLSVTEVFSQLCAERLAKGHPDEKLTRAVEKSAKLRRAHRRKRDEILIQHARALAANLGLQEPPPATPEERPAPGHGPAVCADATTDVEDAARPAPGHAPAVCTDATTDVEEAVRPARVEQPPAEVRSPAKVLAATYENVQFTPCPGLPELQLVQSTRDVPLNPRLRFNPKTRLATPAQKEELKRRDGYKCCVPGCPHCLYLEAHHLIEYSAGGPTEWNNLRMVCPTCHRNVQKGLLKITRNADGSLTFKDRYDRDLRRTQEIHVAGWLDTWQGWRGRESDCHRSKAPAEEGEWSEENAEVDTPVKSGQ